jgi:hypothetical protein
MNKVQVPRRRLQPLFIEHEKELDQKRKMDDEIDHATATAAPVPAPIPAPATNLPSNIKNKPH